RPVCRESTNKRAHRFRPGRSGKSQSNGRDQIKVEQLVTKAAQTQCPAESFIGRAYNASDFQTALRASANSALRSAPLHRARERNCSLNEGSWIGPNLNVLALWG